MKKLLFSLLAFCLVFVSCSKESAPVENGESRMEISSCYVVKNNNTLSENFASPIGLYILTEDNLPYDNSSYKNSASLISGQWKINAPVYVEKPGKVYAYYPYKSGDNPEALAVDMTGQVDILYSKASTPIAPASSSLSVKLYHALSQVTVSVENEEIAGLSLLAPLTGQFNACTGVFSQQTTGVVSSSSGKLLLIPHIPAGDTEMSIRLKGGTEYMYSLSGMDFQPGENYTFQFKLNANRETLEITSISIEDWINDNIYNDYLR